MERQDILKKVDHTLLAPTATWEEIRTILDDAMAYGAASACIPASYVSQAAGYVGGNLPICTVIGFPNGYSASEIDMVINLGFLKDKKFQETEQEIRQIRAACGSKVLKVIIETCLLTEEEKIKMCGIVTSAGADYIKTSTGFSASGATFEDVALMKAHIGSNVRIKAAGGIASFEDAERFIRLGASRLGTSRLIHLLK